MSPSTYICKSQFQSRASPLVRAVNLELQNADILPINSAINIFDWGKWFESKNVHKQVHFFNKTMLNIFHNYIRNKTILCNDRDPPWFNSENRKMLIKKNEIFKHYITNGKSQTD